MTSPDAALEALKEIIKDFSDFIADKGAASEADTRVKLIDRILVQVCGWPEEAITREEHVESGFIDYSLSIQNRRYVAVEAKREGISFVLPSTTSKGLKLSGTLTKDKTIKDVIDQVRGYCDDFAIRYAIATNGYSWIVFRAIREDMPWRDGYARIFPTLENVESNFTDFWNLLSFECIQRGSLDEEFGSPRQQTRKLDRATQKLFNADLPLQRNRLHTQLHPIVLTPFYVPVLMRVG
jgi:predicted type IV restriction endonuclease